MTTPKPTTPNFTNPQNRRGWTNDAYKPAPRIETVRTFDLYVPARDNPDHSRYVPGVRQVHLSSAVIGKYLEESPA